MSRALYSSKRKIECTTRTGEFSPRQCAEMSGVSYYVFRKILAASNFKTFRAGSLRFREMEPPPVPEAPLSDPLIEALRQGQCGLWTHGEEAAVRKWALTAPPADLKLVNKGEATLTVDHRGVVIVGYPAKKHKGIF